MQIDKRAEEDNEMDISTPSSTPKQAAQYSAKTECQTGSGDDGVIMISTTEEEKSTAFNTYAVPSLYDDCSALGDSNDVEQITDIGSMAPLEGHNWKGLVWPE